MDCRWFGLGIGRRPIPSLRESLALSPRLVPSRVMHMQHDLDLHAAAADRLRRIAHTYSTRRRKLVEILNTSAEPLSIPEILHHDSSLAQSSAYRNLAVLELAGVVHRIVTKDEFARFEISEALSGHHHHHLICSSCGSVKDITLPVALEVTVDQEMASVAKLHGFQPTSHQMDLIGICASCL